MYVLHNLHGQIFGAQFRIFLLKVNKSSTYFIGPRLKTGGTFKIRFVRPCVCVCPCVTDYLKHRSKDFSEILGKVGEQ